MNKKFILILGMILLASSSAFFLFPQLDTFVSQLDLAQSILISTTQIVATILFLTSLHAFKKDLKIAYVMLAAGIFMFGVPQMQMPIITFIPVDSLVLSWIVVITSLIGAAIMYVAILKFASLLKVQARWLSPLFIVGYIAMTVLISTFIPHLPDLGDEILVDAIFGMFIAAGTLCTVTALLTLRIREKLGQQYKKAMMWLAVALFAAAFACLHETLIKQLPYFSEPQFEDYFLYGFALLPFLIAAVFFLKASLAFKQTSRRFNELPESATSLEIIKYVAKMASDPSAIDVTLDKLRSITATHAGDIPFSAAEQKALVEVYLRLEAYLITDEPLRKFTKESLREVLPEAFLRQLPTEK